MYYSSGSIVSNESFSKYIEEKSIHSQVFPTCTIEYCAKNHAKKFVRKRARKIDKEWKDEQRMKQRQEAMGIRMSDAQNIDNNEDDVDMDGV